MMPKEQDQESPPPKDRRSRGATEPDPNREDRTGEDGSTITWTAADFAALVAHVQSLGLPVLTISELYALNGGA